MLMGSCACGAVQYTASAPVEEAHHCHCTTCRKSHGAAFATYARVPSNALHISQGRDALSVFRSSPQVQRSFCARCGASLFFSHDAAPHVVWLAAGTLDQGEIQPDAHTFLRSRVSWNWHTDELHAYTGHRPEYGGT